MVRGPQIIRTDKSSQTRRWSLRLTLLAWFLGIAVAPLLVAGLFGYTKANDARQREIQLNLAAVSEIEQAGVEAFFAEAVRDIEVQSRLVVTRIFMADLAADLAASDLSSVPWSRSARWHELTSQSGQELRRYRNNSPWEDILLLDPEGVLLFRCSSAEDLGTNILTGPYSQTNLSQAAQQVLDLGLMVLSPFEAYEPDHSQPVAFLVVPVITEAQSPLGLMAFQISSEKLGRVTANRNLLVGDTFVFLVDDELRALSGTREAFDLDPWHDSVVNVVTTAWLEGGDNLATIASGDGLSAYTSASGDQVFGCCRTIEVLDQRFGLVTEISADQALAGIADIRLAMGLVILITISLVVLAGHMISCRVVRPIVALGEIMKRVADGHDVDDMQVVGHNEVGDLADQFVQMLEHLSEAQHSRDHQYSLQQAQFELNEKMRGETETTGLAAVILEAIGDFYSAQVGAFYLTKPGQRLVLAAQLGDTSDEWPMPELREGQGLVGRAAVRHRIEILRDIPVDHMQVQTAMGRSAPRTVIVAPFYIGGQIKGVMELGTLEHVSAESLEFLNLSAESVAIALDSSRSRERVHRLLDETRRQAEALARQQKELQESNAQLARSDSYKSEFLANMSHELRTPLNSMMLMSQVLGENRRGVLNVDEVEAATTINYAGEELMTIINDILDLSKVEAGKLELSPDEIDLSDLMSDLHHLFKPEADGKNLDFRTLAGPGVPTSLYTDGLRLKQILKNLLNNACKFTGSGSVVLRARVPSQAELIGAVGNPDEQWLALSVADTGIGMTDETKAQVFEAFNQGDGSIGRSYGGSGLGLSISLRLSSLLKGHLGVSSIVGKGSTFTLYLPLTRDHFETSAAQPEPVRTEQITAESIVATNLSPAELRLLAGYQLVLADDEMRTMYRLGDELNQCGLSPILVRSDVELLRLAPTISSRSIVLVNPDCGSAGNSDLLLRLREKLGSTEAHIVALVPSGEDGNIVGADQICTKPVVVEDLLSTCHLMLTAKGVRL